MPRRSSGPRLWLDKSRDSWTIIDGTVRRRTGFNAEQSANAQTALANYIGGKHVVSPSSDAPIADVLSFYLDDHLPEKLSEAKAVSNITNLLKFWGLMSVSDIKASNCKVFAKTKRGARRDLEVMRAAVNHWHRSDHGPLDRVPVFWLPPKPEARERWLTRSEAARLLRSARRVPHLARFIIVSWYTGSRSGVVLDLKWSMIDFPNAILTRKSRGAKKSETKRAPPVRIGNRLMSHLRRWHRLDEGCSEWICHYQGGKVVKLRRSWVTARKAAGLDALVIPHTLRHSRATHLARQGVDPWQAAKSLGMSLQQFERTYAHHHPDWQKEAAEAR
ncbi:MAG: site-specific integrase [Nitrobacter sp.]